MEGKILKIVLQRDFQFVVKDLILYDKTGRKRKVDYRYFGNLLNVHRDYRNQELSLFGYYIYVFILSSVEQIDNYRVRNKVYLEAMNHSSVSENTKHQKCPYCPYFNEVLKIIPKELTEEEMQANPALMEPEKWFNKTGSLYLNPEKRAYREDKNYDYYATQELVFENLKFFSVPTAIHIHLEDESEFKNSVMKVYREKKNSEARNVKLGVQLISASKEMGLDRALRKSNLATNFKTLANTEIQLGITRVPKNMYA